MRKIPVLFLFMGCASLPAQDAGDDKPNILFLLTDDQRADAMGCYGNTDIRTPNFDSIAAEGARMDAFYVAAPLCCPSRAAFLSGLYPHQNGVLDNRRQPDLKSATPTIAAALNKAGYLTGFVGKAHLGGDPRKWDFKEVPLWFPGGSFENGRGRLMIDGVPKDFEGQPTPLFMDTAMKWIEKHKGERWFLWLATTAPHTPYLYDPKYAYKAGEIKRPPLYPKAQSLVPDHDWAGYYATITLLDDQVGRLLQKMRELKLLDKTLLFVASDNGVMHGSHNICGKEVWYEECARVPALARWPGKIKAGSKVDAPLVSVDLYATLCDIAGTKIPENAEGKSMLPALAGREPLRNIAYSEVVRAPEDLHWQMVRTKDWKYVWAGDGKEYLYDLANDPFEIKDLAADRARSKTLEEMRRLHKEWLERTPKLYP